MSGAIPEDTEFGGAVPLARRFAPVPDAYQKDDISIEEIWDSRQLTGETGWETLLKAHRVVILADAGAGKTFELRSAAQKIDAAGKPAFFIRIEDIHADFDSAFEIGDAAVFAKWLEGKREAWFFLDSVDEIRLTTPRAFEEAITEFADRIRDAGHRAHVYISSRPYAWRPATDRRFVEEALPFAQRQAEDPDLLDEHTDIVADNDEAEAEGGDAGETEVPP